MIWFAIYIWFLGWVFSAGMYCREADMQYGRRQSDIEHPFNWPSVAMLFFCWPFMVGYDIGGKLYE